MPTSFPSFSSMFLHRIQKTAKEDAYYYPDAQDNWQTLTWEQVGEKVKALTGGLRALGINLEERGAILCNTRVDWILADLAILCSGGATTTIYPSSSAEETQYILHDSGSRFVFAENEEQVEKILSKKAEIPNLEKIISIDGQGGHDGFVISWKDLVEMGTKWNQENPTAFEDRIHEQKPEHLATLIYTSGTTGLPKGVELTHDCWVFEAEAMDKLNLITATDKQYLWLPLSHSFGKVLEAACIRIGTPTAIDGRIDKLIENLKVVQPTFIAAVPRIFEKVYNKVISGAKANGEDSLKYKIFKKAIESGKLRSSIIQQGREPSLLLKAKYAVYDKLALHKIRAVFGGKIKFFISGSAPLSAEIANFFHAADLMIVEGYGLTESSAASFVNLPHNFKFGTVGKPLPGVELSFLDVGEGDEAKKEILIAGRGIMRGYYNLPEISDETFHIDAQGKRWLRTGDAGVQDADGFLKITDRIKNLIKTSGGKYVAPQKIEGQIKTLCPYISQVLVHGDKRNYCSMLITLDADAIKAWAKDAGLETLSYEELSKHQAVHTMMETYIKTLNESLMSYESIKKFAILPKDLTIEDGDLTPSQKMKRKAVETKYMHVLDGLYSDALKSI